MKLRNITLHNITLRTRSYITLHYTNTHPRSDLVSVSDSNTSMRTTHSIEVDVESLILTSVTQPHGTNVELCDFDVS